MKNKDWQVLSHLRQNGRMSLKDLSKKTKMPVSTIFDRLRIKIQERLCKPSLILNFDKIGFNTRAHILLKVNKQQKQELLKKLSNSPFVNSLYCINNGWDILMECVFKDMRLLENFVETLEQEYEILGKEVHYVLAELRREAFLSDPSMMDLVVHESNI